MEFSHAKTKKEKGRREKLFLNERKMWEHTC